MRYKGLISSLGLAVFFLGMSHSLWAVNAALGKQWMVYGNGQYSQKKYDDAIKSYGNSLKADNTNAAVYQGLGNCYYAKGDKVNALKYYKYALQLNPQNAGLAKFVASLAGASAGAAAAGGADPMAYANTYYGKKNYDYAIYYYKQALATNPNNGKAYQGLGNCYYAKGDKANAITNYQRALDIDPNNAQLRNFLAAYAPGGGAVASAAGATGDKDWVSPAWRSALLPGWGQFYNGESTKGLVIGGVALGLLGGVIGTYTIGSAAQKKYLDLPAEESPGKPSDFDTPFNTWDQMAKLNHMLYYAFGVAWSYGIIDAIWNAKPAQRVGYVEPPLTFGMMNDGFRMDYKLLTF
jgi:tetratricopeptide (TPR) repeat protein